MKTLGLSLPQLLSPRVPFRPQVPSRFIWTSSSLKLFRNCKRKFFWKYIMRLHPRTKSKDLVIGSAFHNCVAHWYRQKRSSMRAIISSYVKQLKVYLQENGDSYGESDLDALSLAIDNFSGMMFAYEDQYDSDRQKWSIVKGMIEKQFLVPFVEFDFAGKIDLAVDSRKHRKIVEHKTSSRLRTDYITRLPLDTQIRGYMLGATEGLKLKPEEVTYDVVVKSKWRKKSGETLQEFGERNALRYIEQAPKFFYREDLPVSQEAIDSFVYELHEEHRNYKRIIKRLDLEDPRAWAPNDDYCDQYFKACEYLDLCLEGLDKSTAVSYDQGTALHEELETTED